MVGVAFICCTFVAKIKCHKIHGNMMSIIQNNILSNIKCTVKQIHCQSNI